MTIIVPVEVLDEARVAPSGHRAETERAIRIQLDVRVPSWAVLSAPDGQPIPGVGDRVVEDARRFRIVPKHAGQVRELTGPTTARTELVQKG